MGKGKYQYYGNKITELAKVKSSTKVQQRCKKLNYDKSRYKTQNSQNAEKSTTC